MSISVNTTAPLTLPSSNFAQCDYAVTAISLESIANFGVLGTFSWVIIEDGNPDGPKTAFTDDYSTTTFGIGAGGALESSLSFDAARITGNVTDDYVTSLSLNQFPDTNQAVTTGPVVNFQDFTTGFLVRAKVGTPPDTTPAVPLPATALFLIVGIGGFGALPRLRA